MYLAFEDRGGAIQFEARTGENPSYGILEGEKETSAWSGGSLPRSPKGRIQRKLIDLNWARLLSTRCLRSEHRASASGFLAAPNLALRELAAIPSPQPRFYRLNPTLSHS